VSGAVRASLTQTWPPFVLVTGLLAIGVVVERDGVFEWAGARVERRGWSAAAMLAALLCFEAVVTAVLNLDTAAVFVTPVLVHAAVHRGCDPRAFLYGALFMANGASLLLPGSNLTNLIVLAHEPLSGAQVAKSMLLPWLAVVLITIGLLVVWYRPAGNDGRPREMPQVRVGAGLAAAAAATVAMLALRNPALPVLAVGAVAVVVDRVRPRLPLASLVGLFLLATALGALAREWDWPASLLGRHGAAGDAVVGAVSSVAVNNLPAAALLSAQPPRHPLALLIGLNLGPNLAVTGSLAALLWYRAARAAGLQPSLRAVSSVGVVLAPLTIAAAVVALEAGQRVL
jgi:arsenical pump membrane protein